MKVHFISIGGSVMHQLAIALHKKGYQVSGSDDEIFEPAASNLKKSGLFPSYIGWREDMISSDLDSIILGMHAKADNPELLKAKSLGLNIYSFPEYIYQESIQKTRVAVGGSHGKTTTTSMIMHALNKHQLNFDYLVGAKLDGFEHSVRVTDAPIMVCEADEYPASAIQPVPKFHFLFPQIAILTGIAWDHINVFPTFPFYLEQFVIFINKIEAGGILIYNESDPILKQLVTDNQRAEIRYQPYSVPSHSIENGVSILNLEGYSAKMSVFGDHNLMNLQAAYLACKELGITAQSFLDAMGDFTGASKRLELIASSASTNVYRDFAHAPSKVKASMDAVKKQFPSRRLIALLELHTYSSLNQAFMPEYRDAMSQADAAVVFYSQHALEIKKLPKISEDAIYQGFGTIHLNVINNKAALKIWLEQQNYQDANLLLMSSGNFDGLDMLSFAKQICK